MWIKELFLSNVKCFKTTPNIALSKCINLFVGRNNSGKSTILHAVGLLQVGVPEVQGSDRRFGTSKMNVGMTFEGKNKALFKVPATSLTFAFDGDNPPKSLNPVLCATSDRRTRCAPVAQWIEHRFPNSVDICYNS